MNGCSVNNIGRQMKILIYVFGFLLVGCVQAQQKQTLMIHLQVKDFQYALTDVWLVPKELPESLNQNQLSAGALKWTIVTADGQTLKAGIIADPQNVTSHDIDSGHFVPAESRLKESAVIIRVAYDPLMSALLIEKMPDIYLTDATKSEKLKPVATQKLLLAPRVLE
jgi:hypothetical protein